MGMVPKNIKSEFKISGGINIFKAMAVVLAAITGFVIASEIFGSGKGILLFTIAFGLVTLLLLAVAPGNRKKTTAQGLVDLTKHIVSPNVMYGPDSEEVKDRRHKDAIK